LSLFSGVLCCTVACSYGRMAVGLLLPMSMFVGFQFYLDAESLKPSSDYLLHVVVWLLACCCPCPWAYHVWLFALLKA
jgi:cbb3-type cytochrome oxidase subunit 1